MTSNKAGLIWRRGGNGTLVLTRKGSIILMKRKLLGGQETDHWKNVKSIKSIRVDKTFTGSKLVLAYEDKDEEPKEYSYALNNVQEWAGRIQELRNKLEEQPPESEPQHKVQTEIIKEREVIREIVKIRCAYCGNTYEEKLDKCPSCGAHAR